RPARGTLASAMPRGRWAPQTPCPLALAGGTPVRPRPAAPRSLQAPARRRLFQRTRARSWPREPRERQPRDLPGVHPRGGRGLVPVVEALIGVPSPGLPSRPLHLPLDVAEEAANGRGRFALYEGPNQTLHEAGHRGVRGDRLREAHPRGGLRRPLENDRAADVGVVA